MATGETSSSRALTNNAPDMPLRMSERVPLLLSQTGVLEDVGDFTPADFLIPYAVNVPFWSDGAQKQRWMFLPHDEGTPGKIEFRSMGEWSFPRGSVFVKHFELKHSSESGKNPQRIETRILVFNADETYGVTYRWREDQTDAELVSSGQRAAVANRSAQNGKTMWWYFPSPKDCATCHTAAAGRVLGVNSRQLNREVAANDNECVNQIHLLSRQGVLEPSPSEEVIRKLPRLVATDNESASLELRSRSYLDANCAYCHRPGEAPAGMDLRFDVPLERQQLVGAPVRINLGIDRARAIARNDPWRSLVLVRMKTQAPTKMPPFHERPDREGIALLTRWIQELPGQQVLSPPRITPPGDDFGSDVTVVLDHPDDEARIHFTLNGSVPTEQSGVYQQPLLLENSATVRARAFKRGLTESITVQETFIIDR